MTIAQEIARIADAEVGVREEPGHNNVGPRIVEYQKATWLDPAAWPWCAAFTCWVLQEALKTSAGQRYLVERNQAVESFRCKDASAFGWLKWAQKHGLNVFDEHSKVFRPRAGDFVVFDFSHIGIVRVDMLPAERYIHTVEGNVAGRGDDQQRDAASSDGVWRKMRKTSLVRGYIRL